MNKKLDANVPVPKKNRLRRWARRLGLLFLLLIGLMLGFVIYYRTLGENRLAAARADADRLDPGWRWDELSRQRTNVPNEENAAPVVMKIASLLPAEWDVTKEAGGVIERKRGILDRVQALEANEQLDADLIKDTRDKLQKVEPARQAAQNLERYRTGRYPDKTFEEFLEVKFDYLPPCPQVSKLFRIEAALRAQEGHPDQSLASCGCILTVGRSIGDDPGLMPLLFRLAQVSLAVQSIERTLAQSQPTEDALLRAQGLLEDEEAQNTLVMAVRGDRALYDEIMTAVDDNQREEMATARHYYEIADYSQNHPVPWTIGHWFIGGWLKENHALMLELYTEAVEIAKLPIEEQRERFEELRKKSNRIHFNTETLGIPNPYRYGFGCLPLSGVLSVAKAYANSRSRLRCAITAVAAERFRRLHNRWPDNLEELAPRFLTRVPVDPVDNKGLKFRRTDDGLLIFAIGPDGVDHGGEIDSRVPIAKGHDIGFRLWNVDCRRQSPAPRLPMIGDDSE